MILKCNSKFENTLNNKNISNFKRYVHLLTLDQTIYIPGRPGNPRLECRIVEKGSELDSRRIAKTPKIAALIVVYIPTLRQVQQKIYIRVKQIKNERKIIYIYVFIRKSYFPNLYPRDSSSYSTPVALSNLVSFDTRPEPEHHSRHDQPSHLAHFSRKNGAHILDKIEEIREEKLISSDNEPIDSKGEYDRPERNGKTGSRNSSNLVAAEASKSTLRSKQAARQQEKTKQSRSCMQRKEKRRRSASKASKTHDKKQEKLYGKDASKRRKQLKTKILKIKLSVYMNDTYNCSIYQTRERNGNEYISTHINDKYTLTRISKYLKTLGRKRDYVLASKAKKFRLGTLYIPICKPPHATSRAHIDPGQNKITCLLYTSPSPRDRQKSRMPSSA